MLHKKFKKTFTEVVDEETLLSKRQSSPNVLSPAQVQVALPVAASSLNMADGATYNNSKDKKSFKNKKSTFEVGQYRTRQLLLGSIKLLEAVAVFIIAALLLKNDFYNYFFPYSNQLLISLSGSSGSCSPPCVLCLENQQISDVYNESYNSWIFPTGYMIGTFFILTSFFHFLRFSLTFNSWYVDHLVIYKISPVLWIEYSITASLMILIINTLCNITSLDANISAFGCTFGCMILGWISEINQREKSIGQIGRTLPALLAWFLITFPWISIFTYFFSSLRHNPNSVPWFVYTSVFSLFTFFNAFGLVHTFAMFGIWPFRFEAGYFRVIFAYDLLSLSAKSTLGWLLVGAMLSIKTI